MKFVVTGGAGFIGSHLVDRLAKERLGEIVVIDNLFRGDAARLQAYIDSGTICFIQGDIRDRQILMDAFVGADVVFHLAAQSNVLGAVTDLDYSFTTNVVGTYHVLSAAKENGVRRFVFTSSREVYGEPQTLPVSEDAPLAATNAYGASKVAGEMYCRVFWGMDLETVILRLANVYGPRDTERVIPLFINQIIDRQSIHVYGDKKVLDFIWVMDVVDIMINVALNNEWVQGPVNIGTGVGTNLIKLADELVRKMGKQTHIHIDPLREHEVNGFVADIGKAEKCFGFQPEKNLYKMIPEIISYWEEARR